ncbi:diadenosine tetraphosphate (Ap4A) HIT family hydrolase [Rhizobium mongolense]|uniref:Diadenosine tetraphosphate (Ap4A) HIT family hydrolase n=1 Tax=Rhizobium mongolense TaxID=57676 RepID=A0A7W6RP03_9HYPH|nr:diadenosine tetraphosphate (Ap4A) HIT family hydrolase [Rhizobium mongolense]
MPGYLMVGSKTPADELSELPASALAELGPLLARVEDAVHRVLQTQRVYIGRYGHALGYRAHFHIVPVYDWVETLCWEDARYRILEDLAESPVKATDGAELTLFVWREFCERAVPPAIKGPSVSEAIGLLKAAMRP